MGCFVLESSDQCGPDVAQTLVRTQDARFKCHPVDAAISPRRHASIPDMSAALVGQAAVSSVPVTCCGLVIAV
jgi:hypothetical protein